MDRKIVNIPQQGGSGKIPTGAIKFKDDWPGLYIRGDFSIFLKKELDEVLEFLRDNNSSIDTTKIEEIIEIINNDVIV